METKLTRAVDVMKARAKRIYILVINVYKLFSFFSSRCLLKEIENMFSVFLSSYRNSPESLGELEKAEGTRVAGECSHSFFEFSQTFTSVSITRKKNGTCFLFLK